MKGCCANSRMMTVSYSHNDRMKHAISSVDGRGAKGFASMLVALMQHLGADIGEAEVLAVET